MPLLLLRHYILTSLLFFSLGLSAQTILNPGDIMVLAYATDLGACGLPAEADEISFVSFKDIETGTTIDITDNGWEHSFAGFWGDSEGTIRLTRTGGTITRGTVITLQGWLNGAAWTYRVISPDNQWTITDLNIPGGPLNMDNGMAGVGGDQVYFMQGGTWDNFGGGTNRAAYDGRILWAFNTKDVWDADGTVSGSNLHPELAPCYYSQGPTNPWFMNFAEYTGPTSGTYWDGDSEEELDHFGYLYLVPSPAYWVSYSSCGEYMSMGPSYVGFTIDIVENMELNCFFCGNGCAPYDQLTVWTLPMDGEYNITYSVGGEIFTVMGAKNGDQLWIPITEDVEVAIISIEKAGGCTVYSNFSPPFVIDAFAFNAGVYTELWVCSNHPGQLDLDFFLQGNPEPGGIWIGPGYNLTEGIWIAPFGPNEYIYTIVHPHGSICVPPYDSATLNLHTIDPSNSLIEVSCDQNGTPNDIFDDALVFTITVVADGIGPDYMVTIPGGGTVTPIFGLTGIPQTFTLWPGSALVEPSITINIRNLHPEHIPGWICNWPFVLESPGFCSDPCDYDMEASISGNADICIGNCPDEPATFTIETNGGTEPYKMDFTVSAPTFPTWNFNNVFISSFDEIEVCVDKVPAPVFNEATNKLTLPETLAGQDVLVTLSNVYDKYDCTANLDNNEIYLTIHKLPKLDTIPPLNLCSEFAVSIDLTQYDEVINPFLDIVWYDGNPLGAGEKITNPEIANLHNVGELWAYAMDDFCENAIKINFKIFPSPQIDTIPPVEICTGDFVVLQSLEIVDAGNSNATYSFHINTPLDSSTLLDPAFYMPADSTTVFLLATSGFCFDTMPVDINVQDYPDFNLQATPCDLLLDTYTILFTSSADSIWASAGTVLNNPAGQDQITGIPNNVSVSIEVLNSTSLCKDTFMITAPNCNCPVVNQPLASQPSYSICEGSPIPVLTVTVGAGLVANWYTVPSGGIPFLQNSLTYQPPSAASANYYVEALDPANGCYSIRTEIPFVVNPLADLQSVADQILCETETINLNTLAPGVLNGVNGTGSWFNLSNNQPVSGTIQPQNGDTWYYLFSTNPGNCQSSDTMSAVVNPMPAIDLYTINCDENTLTYELLFTSDANDVQTSAGNLSQISGTDSFALSNIPFDTDIQFVLENTITGCDNSFTIPAPDCSCPALLQQTDHEACSDEGNIDLSAFEGFGVTGNWQLVSTPAGSNPAVLAGNTLQVQSKDAGLYTLRFIRSIILDNCIDTASFLLTLHTSPAVDAGTDGTACAPDDILLSGNASGSNLQFNWQTSGSGVITNPNALNTSYTPTLADITAGTVSFTLTAVDQTGFCPSAQETIDITIDASAYFILDPATQTYCDTSDITVDFDDLITFGTTSGHWFFPPGVTAPITGNSMFNPTTLQAGNYTVFYTTSSATPPCDNDTLGINLIIENCLCPSVALSTPSTSLCSGAGTQNLNDFLITNEAGTWSIVSTPSGSNPANLNGTNFVTSNSDAGTYRLRFTLSSPVSGCDEFAEIDFDVIETPSIQISSVDCADDLQSWQAIIVTSAEVVSNTLGILTSLGNDRYLIENITLNTGLQINASNGNGLCTSSINIPTPDCECTLAIDNLPDDIALCPGETFVLEAEVSGGKGAVTQFWIVGNDSLYQNSLQVGQAGTYQFVSFDELGCKEDHSVEVTLYEEMVADVSTQDITCPGDKDGIIILHSITGGNGPFFISINGAASQEITSFPYMINNLGAANYQIELSDGFSCMIEFTVMVQSASSENVDLGPDQTILVGDSVQINPFLTFTPDSFYWTGDIDIIDPALLINWVSPDADKVLELFAIDDKGCLYSDDIMIRVLLTSSIYVPTVFSPNDDGNNDLIAPFTDPSITTIDYFEIYSRWGELLYSQKNFTPNQANFGWDGTLREKPAMPGVYVYRLKAFNKRGREYLKTGEITLLR